MGNELDFDGDHGATYVDEIRHRIPGYEAMHAMTAALLVDALPGEKSILVVGCGGGEELVTLRAANPAWRLVGVDPSEQMVAITRRRCHGEQAPDIHHGHLDTLPTDTRWDGATSMLVLHFIRGDDGKREHLVEIARRLKPGAPLMLAAVMRHDPSPLKEALEKGWGTYAILKGADPAPLREKMAKIKEEIDPIDETTLMRLLAEAGFPTVQRFSQSLRFSAYMALRK